jgi:Domain of unknown function (DUF3883)
MLSPKGENDMSQMRDSNGFELHGIEPANAYGKRPIRCIEVKGRSGYNQPIVVTTYQRLQAQRHTDSDWLYVIWAAAGQNPNYSTRSRTLQQNWQLRRSRLSNSSLSTLSAANGVNHVINSRKKHVVSRRLFGPARKIAR